MRHGSGSAASANSGDAPAFYEWNIPGGAFSIQLGFDVIERMGADIMKGFWSLPKRGVEIGGILLGRVAEGGESVIVEDYEQVTCEHRRGPSYVLSEPDRRKLEKALRKGHGGRQVVGFFRSHTRLGLYLDQDDASLIESYFSSPNHVFLLVRPDSSGPVAAGFFFWEEGDIRRQSTYREFPFSTVKLLQPAGAPAAEPAAPVLVQPAPQAPALVVPRTPLNQRPPMQLHLPRPRWGAFRSARLGIAALAALALVSAGVVEYHLVRSSAGVGGPRTAPVLQVRQNGAYLQVNWDRGAPAVVSAVRGVLSISDGSYSRDIDLDPQQLRSGSLAYLPAGNDVNFRLMLLCPKETVNESLRVLTADTVAKAAPPPPTAGAVTAAEAAPDRPAPKPRARAKRPFFDDGL